jgi:hypothetical protein
LGAEIKWGIVSRDKLREVDLKDPADAKAMVGSFFLTVAPSWAANRLRSVTTLADKPPTAISRQGSANGPCRDPHHRAFMMERPDPTDYSITVKRNRTPRNSWRWEINRPGKSTPVKQSADHFQTMAEATRAGKEALQRLLKLRINLFVRER